MFTILSRIVHYGFRNFMRNGLLSTATVAIMVLALLVFMGLILFEVVADRAVASIQDKIDISVYFKKTTPEDRILEIKESLEKLPEVERVEYVSEDKALDIFKSSRTYTDSPEIGQALAEINTNPLAASLNIKARKPDQYASIADYLDAPSIAEHVYAKSYEQNKAVIHRLANIVDTVNRGGLAAIVLLAAIAGLVVFNTIRIVIHSNREEIGVMRAVGASNFLVRGPLVVEGLIAGVLAAVVSVVIAAPLVYVASPYLKEFIPSFDMLDYFWGNGLRLFGYQLLFGVGIGCISSFVAVRRYLKN